MPSEGHAVVCGDPQSFATAIDQLLSDPSQQHHMAQQAKAQIQKNFSWESHVAGLEQILKDAAQ
jgi:glycosyltransferase involved in cell wall biosynthesis